MNPGLKQIGCIAALALSPLMAGAQAMLSSDYHAVKNVPSPTAASLGTYGDVPLDYFTGAPSIAVPLTSISYDGISVPVSLSYHSSGIRVSEMPGWAGLGWDVVAGGQITRKVNWFPDEFYNRHPNISPGIIDRGFYFLGAALDVPDWSSSSKLTNFINPDLAIVPDAEPDEFTFSFAGYSGSFYRSEKGEWKVKSKDGVQFEINGELDNSANYMIIAGFDPSGNPTNITNDHVEYISSVFTKFTVRTPDGFVYEFGGYPEAIEFSRGTIGYKTNADQGVGAYDDKRNEIVSNNWYLTKITNPAGNSVVLNYKRGKVIYQKQRVLGLAYNLSPSPGNTSSNISESSTGGLSSGATAINPAYLESIETPLAKLVFVTSNATELKPEQAVWQSSQTIQEFNNTLFTNWFDLNYSATDNTLLTLPNYNLQLDSIKVFDKTTGSYVNGIKLFQRSDLSKRRTLDSVSVFDWSGNNSKYKFAYSHVDDLPVYESLRTDHWGFFNASTEPGLVSLQNKEPNSYCLYGLIDKITYPTGGSSTFTFEPALYSSVVQVDPNATQPVSAAAQSGMAGIRLKKVTSDPGYSSPPLTTEYFYNTDYANGGTASSGVLSAMPRYVDQVNFNNPGGGSLGSNCAGDFTLRNQSANNSEWSGQVKGGIVTYSEVTKKAGDGSYTVYKYTNNDNAAYRDEIAVNYVNYGGTMTYQNNYRLSSNDLERGKLLSEERYAPSGLKAGDVTYEYLNAAGRKNDYIKSVSKKVLMAGGTSGAFCPGTGMGGGMRGWATKIYYYRNPLKSVVRNDYEGNETLTNTQTFSYDVYGNVTRETKRSSDDKLLIKTTKYNADPSLLVSTAADADAAGLKNLYQNLGIRSLPVEVITSQMPATSALAGSERITGGMIYKYDATRPVVKQVWAMELAEPFYPVTYSGVTPTYYFTNATVNASGNFINDSRYKIQHTINTFSTYPAGVPARPLSVVSSNVKTAYTWDYNLQYVTSKTNNASSSDVAYTSFEGSYLAAGITEDNKGHWQFDPAQLVAGGITGKKCIGIGSTGIGINYIQTDFTLLAGKKYLLSWWSKGTAPVIMNGSTNLSPFPSSSTDWKYNTLLVTGNGAKVSLNAWPGSAPNSTYVDEVRLVPESASMTSYTYDPVNGNVTSITDERSMINRYEYDLFGRLILVKDIKGNILKKQDYQFQAAP